MPGTAKDRLQVLRAATEEAMCAPGPKCSVCQLPKDVLEMVTQLHSEGMRYSSIELGLRAVGIDTKAARIAWHYRNRHGQSR